MTIKKTYTKEFKCEAVRLLETSDKTGAEVSRQLGIKRNKQEWGLAIKQYVLLQDLVPTF